MAEALKTIPAPIRQSASVTPNNCLSGCRLRGIAILCPLPVVRERSRLVRRRGGGMIFAARYQFFESAATLFVVLELIETGAGRREQHRVAGLRRFYSQLHRAFERSGLADFHGAFQIVCNFR